MLHLHLLGQEKKIPKFTFSNNFWCFHPKIHSVPSAFLCVTSSSWSAQKTEIPVLFLDPAGSQNLFFLMTEGSTQGCVLHFQCCHRWDALQRAWKTQLLLGKQPPLPAACPGTSLKHWKKGRGGADKSQMKAKMRPRIPQRKGKMEVKISRLIQEFSHTFYKV